MSIGPINRIGVGAVVMALVVSVQTVLPRPAVAASPPTVAAAGVGVAEPLSAGAVPAGEVVADRQADPRVLSKPPLVLPVAEKWTDRAAREARNATAVKGFDPATSVEVAAERARFASVFKNVDGTYTAKVEQRPVHFETEPGKWEKIDPRVVPDPALKGEWVTASSSVQVRFSSRGVELRGEKGSRVAWKPRGVALGDPVLAADGLSATYVEVWPNVDVRFRLFSNEVKEEIVIKGPTTVSSFPFDVSGVDVQVDANGRPTSRDPEFSIGQVEILDRDSVPVDRGVSKGAARKLDGGGLAVEVDPVWLAGVTSFPLVVDPTWSWWTYLLADGYEWPHGWSCGAGCYPVRTGNSQADGDTIWRHVAAWDYSSVLPTGTVASTLLGANFTMTYSTGTANAQQVAVRHATGFGWCGFNYGNDCGQGYTPALDVQWVGTGSATLNVMAPLLANWSPGASLVAFAFSGDEPGGGYTYKGLNASLNLTFNRVPMVLQSQASPVNGFTLHPDTAGIQLSVPALTDPDGETVYYRFVVCENPSWASCTVRFDSGYTTSNTYNTGVGAGLPANLYNLQLYWGVIVSNTAGYSSTEWLSPWMNAWKLVNSAAPDPQLLAPVDGFRWAPNASPTFTISRYADPDGDAVAYRLVLREPGATGALWRSDWTTEDLATGNLNMTIPASAPLVAGKLYEWTTELRDSVVYFHWYFYQGQAQAAATTYRSTRFEQRLGSSGPSPFQSLGPVTVNLATGNVTTSVGSVGYEALGGSIGATLSYNSRAQDTGLRARLFNDYNANALPDDALVTERVDREMRFSWTSPASVPGVSNFVGSWTGFLTAPVGGVYKFGLAAGANDKVKIEVGSYWVQANQTTQAEIKLDAVTVEQVTDFEARTNVQVSTTAGITLAANTPVAVKVTYSNPSGPGALGMYVTGANPSGASLHSLVPGSWLTPDAPVAPRGWTFNHQEGFAAAYTQVVVEASQVVVTRTDGEKLSYVKKSDGGFTPPPGEDDVLTFADGVVTLTDTEGTVYKFRADGQLDTITSPVDHKTPAAAVPGWSQVTPAGWSQPMSRLTALTDPASSRSVTFIYQGLGGTCPTKAGYVAPAIGMLCQVTLPDGSATKIFYTQPATGVFRISRIEQPGDATTGVPAIDYGYGTNGLLSTVRDALVNEAIDTAQAGVNSTTDFTTNVGFDATLRATSVQAPKAAPTDTARQRVVMQYKDVAGQPTNETWVLVDGLENTGDPNDWDRKVTFDQDARVLLDYQATNATSGQSMRTETRWDTVNDRPLVNISNGQASTSFYNHRGELVTTYGPANQSCFDLTTTSPTYRLPNGSCTTPPVAMASYEYDTLLNANGSSSPFTNLGVSLWPNAYMAGKPNVKTTGFGGTPTSFVYNWGATQPAGATTADFSFQAIGELRFTSTGTYTIEAVASTDDFVKVYVDDQLIVNKPNGATTTATGTYLVANNVELKDGTDHVRRVRVDYQDITGNASLTLNWTPPSSAKVAIPIDRFRPRYSLQTRSTVASNNATDAPAQVTHTSYDTGGIDPGLGIVTMVTEDPAGLKLQTVTGYETAGYRRRISRTLPAGNVYGYEYYSGNAGVDTSCTTVNDTTVNQGGKLRHTTSPVAADGKALRSESIYDALGRVVAVRQGSRVGSTDTWETAWTCTTYDLRHRVSQVTVPAFGTQTVTRTVSTNFRVGGNPRVVSVTDPAGTITTTVDILGRVVAYTDVWAKTTTTSFDQTTGRVTSTSGPTGVQGFTYDRAGRLTAQTLDGVTVATPTYEVPGSVNEFVVASVAYGNGTSVTNGRNTSGAVTAVTWKQGAVTLVTDTVTKVQDGRTIANSMTWAPTASTTSQSYRFDAAGRLTRALIPGKTIDYNYATAAGCTAATNAFKNSNRSSVATTPSGGSAVTESFCYDQADRLVTPTTGVTALVYDNRGNTTTVNSDVYGYDGANRHTQTVNGATTVSYVRDATDRIVERKLNGVTVARYTFSGSGDTPDGELDATNVVLRRTVGLIGGAILSRATGADVWSISNLHGDTIATLSATGTVTGGPFTYDPYGKAIGGVPDNQVGSFDNGWLGNEQRTLEQEPGLRQTIEMGVRPFELIIGRFLTVDPIQGGNSNDYSYVNDPVNAFDVNGFCAKGPRDPDNPLCNGVGGIGSGVPNGSKVVGAAGAGKSSAGKGGDAEHTKNPRPSNKEKHEKGKGRKVKDKGGERGDARRPYRKSGPNARTIFIGTLFVAAAGVCIVASLGVCGVAVAGTLVTGGAAASA